MSVTLIQTSGQGPMGPMGPQGPAGSNGTDGQDGVTTILYEDEMPLAKRTDIVNDNLIYQGEAQPGTLSSAAGWRIKKLIIGNDGDVDTLWAGGTAEYVNVWNDRAALSYI